MRRARVGVTPLASVALGAILGGSLVAASMVAQQVVTSPTGTGRVIVARPETAVSAPIVVRAARGQQDSSTRRLAPSVGAPETFGRRGTDVGLIAFDTTSLDLSAGALTTPSAGLVAALNSDSLSRSLLRSAATRAAFRAERTGGDDEDDVGKEDDDGEENEKSHGRGKGKAHRNAKGRSSGRKAEGNHGKSRKESGSKKEKSDEGAGDRDHEAKENGKEKDDGKGQRREGRLKA